jgi:hypothetical protein
MNGEKKMTTRQRSTRNEDEPSLSKQEALILFRKARRWEYTGGGGSSHYAADINDPVPLSLRLSTYNGGEAEIWAARGSNYDHRVFNYWFGGSDNNRDPFYLLIMKVSRKVDARNYSKRINVLKDLVTFIRGGLRK